jgi:hypothetical protein
MLHCLSHCGASKFPHPFQLVLFWFQIPKDPKTSSSNLELQNGSSKRL